MSRKLGAKVTAKTEAKATAKVTTKTEMDAATKVEMNAATKVEAKAKVEVSASVMRPVAVFPPDKIEDNGWRNAPYGPLACAELLGRAVAELEREEKTNERLDTVRALGWAPRGDLVISREDAVECVAALSPSDLRAVVAAIDGLEWPVRNVIGYSKADDSWEFAACGGELYRRFLALVWRGDDAAAVKLVESVLQPSLREKPPQDGLEPVGSRDSLRDMLKAAVNELDARDAGKLDAELMDEAPAAGDRLNAAEKNSESSDDE